MEHEPSRFNVKLLLNVLIAVLVVAALGLSYALYQQYATDASDDAEVAETRPDESDASGTPPSPPEEAFLPELSEKERDALTPPGAEASEEEKRAHFDLVQEVAVNESTLIVGANCTTYPAVMRTKLGTELTFLNRDSVQHVITFNEDHSYILPPGESVPLFAGFGQGAGVYGYGCDEGTVAAGMMLVAE